MVVTAVSLLTALFLGFLSLYFYRIKRKEKASVTPLTTVPLRVDRKALLAQKKQDVADRRGRLTDTSTPKPHRHPASKPPKKESTEAVTELSDGGFGEDLGLALTLSQKPEKRSSRFSKLKAAAHELEDAYKQNNTIQP